MDENKSQLNNKGNLKNLRTYQTDMADSVRTNEISVIKVALAEQNKHEREDLYRKIEGTPTKKIFWVIGGLIIIGGALYGSYYFMNKKVENNIPIQTVKEESIISYDETVEIILNPSDDLINKIHMTFQSGKDGAITYLPIRENINGLNEKINVAEIFTKLKFTAPSSLVRSLSDSYMAGILTKNISNNPDHIENKPNLFFIFQSTDYEYTYAGMLDWEKTLASDAYELFNLVTTENKLKLSERLWRDIVINNKDARVLYNEDNKPILYYIFIDKKNLVLTDNYETIKEIISRLLIKNIKPL
jgi:site-specific DNA-adenine methylase